MKTATAEKGKPLNPEYIGKLKKTMSGYEGQFKPSGGTAKDRSGAAKSPSGAAKKDGNEGSKNIPAIDVKTAVQNAIEYAKTFYPNLGVGDIQLEEVEFDESKNIWKITLSFPGDASFNSNILLSTVSIPRRKYKIFTLDATGNVKSMKIRDL